MTQPATAASFDLFGLDGSLSLTGSYAYAIRLEEPDQDVINTAGRAVVPIPEEFKFPNSHNFDDGDRNFDQYEDVTNRGKLFSEMELKLSDNFGIKVSGDAFYDQAYKSRNDNESPESLNSRQQPPNSFNNQADFINGGRARLLDAYAYGTFFFGDTMALDLKAGQHVVAWGESLFFSGVARAQGPADATRANLPGTDVKSILLPVTQASARFSLTDNITLLAQQKLQYQPNLINPTGGFFSASDIVGPGADFAYGIKNPLFLDTLAEFDLTSPSDLQGITNVLDQLLLGSETQEGPLNNLIDGVLDSPLGPVVDALPTVSLPRLGNLLNAPRGLNPQRVADTRPTNWNKDQWGLGLEYDLNFTTSLGYYHLNYHSHIPLPRQNFGFITLIPQQGVIPEITSEALGLRVPVTYTLQYYEDIKLDALSFSTVLFGANVAGEFIYRQGAPTLVDVDNGIAGPVPTPSRIEDSYQVLLNSIKTFGPGPFWDTLTFVGEIGYIYADNIQPQISQAGPNEGEPYNEITSRFDRDAAAFATRIIFGKNGVFPGWDLSVPINIQGQVYNRPPIPGTFGALLGEDDYRFGISLNFTRLQKLTLGITYNGFWGHADEDDRPLQDRDTLGVTASYDFF